MKAMTIMLLTAGGLYLLVAVLVYSYQRRLQYFPDTTYVTPAQAGLQNVDEIVLKTPDTERLLAWYAPAPPGNPTFLYFHGNGGGLVNRAERLAHFRSQGYGVLLVTYRGYAGSSGTPAEAPIIRDALYAWQWLVNSGVGHQDIILYGESLGTGVAVAVAAAVKNKPAATILESPYTSTTDVGAAHYPWLPVRWLMKDRYDSASRIGQINTPLLILHGTRDQVIDIKFGRRLFDAALEPKQAHWLKNGGHNDLYSHNAWQHISAFLKRYRIDAIK